MYVRLSDGQRVQPNNKPPDHYVYIPQEKIAIKEELLDHLTDTQWRALMAQIAVYQEEVETGQKTPAQSMADRATRRAQRKAKQDAKQTKAEIKNQKKSAQVEIKKAKAEAKKSGRGADILGSVIEGAKSFMGINKPPETTDTQPPSIAPDGNPSFLDTPLGLGIAIGGGALLLGGAIYLISKPRNQ